MRRLLPVLIVLAGCPGPEVETFDPWTLPDLAATEGFSLRTPEFDVPAGQEVQDCYFVQVPDLNGGQDLWVDRVVMAMNPGSHHLNVFRVKDLVELKPEDGSEVGFGPGMTAKVVYGGPSPTTPCWKSGNWATWPIVANNQNSVPNNPYTDWTLPAGVAMRFTPGEMLMVQTHYVNATTQETRYKGKAGINFHRFQGAAAPQELGTLFATQQSIRVCQSSPTPSYSGACHIGNEAVTVTAVNGHFHSRGKRFSVYSWDGNSTATPPDGSRFYTSDRWDEPPMATGISAPITAGGGVWWTCDFQWVPPGNGCDAVNARDKQMQNDCCYTFGPVVETSEHCNVFVYYYPKVADVGCL